MKPGLRVSFVVLSAVAIVGLSTAAGSTRQQRVHVDVKPGAGSPTTKFVVSFLAPDRTGRTGLQERRYLISASTGLGASACVSSVDQRLPYSRLHAHVHVTLDPARLGGRWCPGTLRGRIEEVRGPSCVKRLPCPEFASTVSTIGRFAVTVHTAASTTTAAAGGTTTAPAGGTTTAPAGSATTPAPGGTTTTPHGSDTTPPTFAGLQSAFACTPGPQQVGQTTPFTLTWKAATDDVTPSSQIVYDVYESSTRGGETFSHPTWTTPPGVTSFKTPGLPSHGTFYFVVRSRDQAGNEDQNRVELPGVDPCV
jgi:hypothetical protein